MADNKKYYYLKLKENFFDTDEMIILESMPDGYMYSNILLKLYLRSLKYDGRLMFNDRIPFNPTMLAQVTRHSVGVVEKAMDIFQQLGLIEILDNGAIYISDIQDFIGKSSTEADRKRTYRNRIEAEKTTKYLKDNGTNVQTYVGTEVKNCPDKSTPEIELEIELEIDKEKDAPKGGLFDKKPKTRRKKSKAETFLEKCEKVSMEFDFSDLVLSKLDVYFNMLAEVKSFLAEDTIRSQLSQLADYSSSDTDLAAVIDKTVLHGWKSLNYAIEGAGSKGKFRDTAYRSKTKLFTEEEQDNRCKKIQEGIQKGTVQEF